jgi:hypothetical protein
MSESKDELDADILSQPIPSSCKDCTDANDCMMQYGCYNCHLKFYNIMATKLNLPHKFK